MRSIQIFWVHYENVAGQQGCTEITLLMETLKLFVSAVWCNSYLNKHTLTISRIWFGIWWNLNSLFSFWLTVVKEGAYEKMPENC